MMQCNINVTLLDFSSVSLSLVVRETFLVISLFCIMCVLTIVAWLAFIPGVISFKYGHKNCCTRSSFSMGALSTEEVAIIEGITSQVRKESKRISIFESFSSSFLIGCCFNVSSSSSYGTNDEWFSCGLQNVTLPIFLRFLLTFIPSFQFKYFSTAVAR